MVGRFLSKNDGTGQSERRVVGDDASVRILLEKLQVGWIKETETLTDFFVEVMGWTDPFGKVTVQSSIHRTPLTKSIVEFPKVGGRS